MTAFSKSPPGRFPPAPPVPEMPLALAAFAGSVVLLVVGDPDLFDEAAWRPALALSLLALASLPLLAVHRSPLAVFLTTAVAQSAVHLLASPVGPPLGPTVAVFFLAADAYGSRRRALVGIAAVAAMLLLHAFSTAVSDDRWFPGTELLFGTLLWGAAWLAGDRSRLRAERIVALEERASRAEREAARERELAAAEERTRIARDLHDSAGHAINVILVHAGAGRLLVDRDPARAREALATIEEVARETVGEIDQMVGALREPGVGVEAPPGLAALPGLCARQSAAGPAVELARHGGPRDLPAAVERGAYRIVQEALTNAARHGGGAVTVELGFGERELTVTVRNPCRPAPAGNGNGGHGLIGMRERVRNLGGTLEAGAAGGEFRLRAELPLSPEDS